MPKDRSKVKVGVVYLNAISEVVPLKGSISLTGHSICGRSTFLENGKVLVEFSLLHIETCELR